MFARCKRYFGLTGLLLLLAGCHHGYAPPEQPMPPNTVLLSQMMRDLSAQPGFTQAMLHDIDASAGDGGRSNANKKGPALLTPALVHDLRTAVLGRDWQHLDRFPGWTMREINPTVRVVGHFAGRNSALEVESSVHPGSRPASGDGSKGNPPFGSSNADSSAPKYLDVGPYALSKAEEIDLNQPSTLPPFSPDGIVTKLGYGVTRGDGPNALAPEHAASQRLADVLNRLSANSLDAAAHTEARVGQQLADTPQDLIAAMAGAGFQITVIDARYFANFGHFHYKPQGSSADEDVMMPFWVSTRLAIPGTGGPWGFGARALLLPVSHAEYEWSFRSAAHPELNADVSYYFGIDGKSEWRTMDTQDQAWVLKRAAHTYTGAQAKEVTRLASLLTVAYMHQHARRAALPFGGYYALGVCQDGVSAIEQKLTGDVTLFPNTVDASLFDDPRDAEVNRMMAAIPKDRSGRPPDAKRVFGSLPAWPGPDGSFAAITIPGYSQELAVTYAAWQEGTLYRTHHLRTLALIVGAVVAVIVALLVFWSSRRAAARRRRTVASFS